MSLYRGAGGASDATDDSTVNAVAGYASSAASSASAAAASATTATNNATAAATSASQAASSTSSAATSASNAATSASNAASSASSASSSASSASTSATNASNSAGNASTYASEALGYRNTASTHATNAASSASAAAGSATSAANSAASALAIYGNTAAMEAAVDDAQEAALTAQQESQAASDSAIAAAESEDLAFEYSQNAAESATTAQSAANSAIAASTSANAAWDQFDDRYLGAKAADPTVDNDGNALITGALYFNTSTSSLKVYTGSVWTDAYTTGNGFLVANNNLSDLQSAATARTNLGLGTAALENSTALVHTTGNETIAGTKTFSSTITGSITGNAGTVTNGVYTTGDQTIAGTKTFSSNPVLSAGTVNGVAYLNGSKVLTTGSALTFDGTSLGLGTSSVTLFGGGYRGEEIKGTNGSSLYFSDTGGVASSAFAAWSGAGNFILGTTADYPISFRTNSTEQMRLTSTGLGIGTSSPSFKLDLNGSFRISNGTNPYIALYNGSNTGYVQVASGNLDLIPPSGGNTTVSSGNVGIGTSSPSTRLHVTTGATGAQALFSHTSGTPTIAIGNSTTTYNTQIGYNVTSEYGYIQAVAAAGVYDDIAINPLGGNVGIGTSSPSSFGKLAVIGGNVHTNQNFTTNAAGGYWASGASTYAVGWYEQSGSMLFRTATTNRLTLDASGNLGLGVTPSASTTYPALEVGAGNCIVGSAGSIDYTCNAFYNGSFKYKSTGTASYYEQSLGKHMWFTAPSGTAGNAITFTQAMTLDASGRLGIGTTSPAGPLHVVGGSDQIRSGDGTTTSFLGGSGSTGYTGTLTNHPFLFYTNSTERMRITAAGLVGIGTSSPNRLLTMDGGGSDAYLKLTTTSTSSSIASGILFNNPSNGDGNIMIRVNADSSALQFYTGGSERMRIDSSGNLLVGKTAVEYGVLEAATGTQSWVQYLKNTAASGAVNGSRIAYTNQTPNNTTNYFLFCEDATATRVYFRSNGGLSNYQANDTNLSDRREKTNFAPAGEYLSKICAIPVQTFNYIDQNMEEDPGTTLGVVAQDVQAVAPELVMESNWGTKDEPKMRLSIYQTDLQYALMKALQELKAEFDAYKATHP